ncbi:MAG: succinate dehydrogenase, cytochrome b556 subunit [Pseudomonadota bacterium]
MKKDRPVNLDIGTMRLPITAWTSIAHRISGVFLFAVVGLLLWMLDQSLAGADSFSALEQNLAHPLVKLIIWAALAGLIYHGVAGVKHLVMDMGFGETMEGGSLGSRVVIGISLILVVLAGVWLW